MARPKGGAGNSKKVLDTLREYGPMTNRALVELTGIPQANMNAVLFKLHQTPKLIYITSWEELTHDGFNTRPHACYAIGTHRGDTPKPPPLGHNAVCKRRRSHLRKRVNSVFNLGAINVNEIFQERSTPVTHANASRG